MSKIFISYRRSDSGHVTGRIYDHLLKHFKREEIFKDVDSIPVATNFRQYIKNTIISCDVVLVVIGNSWLTVTDKKGTPRLADPGDTVRCEIETALEHGIIVLPLLLDGMEMPDPGLLPPSLQSLTELNSLHIRPDPDFNNDMERLIRAITSILKTQQPEGLNLSIKSFSKSRFFKVTAIIALSAILITVFVLMYPKAEPAKKEKAQPTDTLNVIKHSTTTAILPNGDNQKNMKTRNITLSDATVSIKKGENIYLTVDIGNAQLGSNIVLRVNDKNIIATGEIKELLIGKAEELAGKIIRISSNISDVNEASNEISVVDTFKNGSQAYFKINNNVESNGDGINIIRSYRFIKSD